MKVEALAEALGEELAGPATAADLELLARSAAIRHFSRHAVL